VFSVPLGMFLSNAHHDYEDRDYGELRVRLHFFHNAKHPIWGLTAHVLIDIARLAYGAPVRAMSAPPFSRPFSQFSPAPYPFHRQGARVPDPVRPGSTLRALQVLEFTSLALDVLCTTVPRLSP
jgi:hypothetical protein